MFGLFKRKKSSKSLEVSSLQMDLRSAVAPLLKLNGSLSDQLGECYGELDHNPAELRFFSMAATSVFVQSFGKLPQEKMQALVGMFYEHSAANSLLYMPRADFSVVYAAATQRFGVYADLIMRVINANTEDAQGDANTSLITILDEYAKVERGAFDRSLAGLMICSSLVDHAVQVKDAVEAVRGAF